MTAPWAALQASPARLPLDTVVPPPLPDALAADWPARRASLAAAWAALLGPAPAPIAPAPEVLEQVALPDHRRMRLRYWVAEGEWVEAFLLQPAAPRPEAPGVVVFHPTTFDTIAEPVGLAGPASRHTALHLVAEGYSVLCPECFLWHYRDWRPPRKADWRAEFTALMARIAADHPGLTGMGKLLADARQALTVLAATPGVAPERLGAFGFSLGAKVALYLAACDPRLRAAVSVDGGLGLRYSNWADPWYLGAQAASPDFGHDHHELLALAAPCAVLIAGSTGGVDEETQRWWEGYDGERSWPHVAAALPAYRQAGAAERLGLLCHGHGHSLPAAARATCYAWLQHWL